MGITHGVGGASDWRAISACAGDQLGTNWQDQLKINTACCTLRVCTYEHCTRTSTTATADGGVRRQTEVEPLGPLV